MIRQFSSLIHRHTGGLENINIPIFEVITIHRHTGGLEKEGSPNYMAIFIHRHTGGLES